MSKKLLLNKPLALVLTVVLVMALFAGCGGGGGEAGGGDADTGKTSIKIGWVAPFTGPMASFTVGIKYTAEEALKIMNADGGIYIKELDKKLPVEVIWGDSESDPTKASEVATKLVTGDKVDILVGEWTPATTNPVSVVAERNQVPALVINGPDTSWLEGGPYTWTFGMLFDYNKFIDEYFNGWDRMDTNKKIGLVLDSSVDGIGAAEIIKKKAPERGYTVFDPGRFPEGTKDYMQVLSQIQKEQCDILVASFVTPEVVTVWNNAQQLGYIPKTVVLSKGLHTVPDVMALGEGKGQGVCIETQWSRHFPFTSSLTGKTAEELSAEFEENVNASPDLTIGWDWGGFDVIAHVLQTAQTLDKETLRQTFASTDIDCIYGNVKFGENHVGYVPIVFGQWVIDEKWGYKKNLIAAGHVPEITQFEEPILVPGYNSSN